MPAQMTCHSFSSGRTERYVVEPYRLAYGQGGLHLFAFARASASTACSHFS